MGKSLALAQNRSNTIYRNNAGMSYIVGSKVDLPILRSLNTDRIGNQLTSCLESCRIDIFC
jgi:hypothetical protein